MEEEKISVIDARYASIQINHIRAILEVLEKSILPNEGPVDFLGQGNSIEAIENLMDALREEVSNLNHRYKFTVSEAKE